MGHHFSSPTRFILTLCAGIFYQFSVAFAAPQVYWASDPVNPGETVLVTGDDLADTANVRITRLTDTASNHTTEPNTEVAMAQPVQVNSQSVKFVIPANLRPGVYRYALIGSDRSTVGYLNCAAVYWTQGDLGTGSSAGGWVRVLGRNIARSPAAALLLTPSKGNGPPVRLVASQWNSWDTLFQVPSSLSPGDYLLKIWNGQGDRDTWRDAGLLVIKGKTRPSPEILNARDYGAVGDGHRDDTAAVTRALSAIQQRGGGILFFPRGRYLISDTLVLPEHSAIKGEGRELVSLNWPEFRMSPPSLIVGRSDFAVTDITLYASNYASVISGGFENSSAENREKLPQNIAIERVTIRASAYRGHISARQAVDAFEAGMRTSILNGPDTIRLSGENLIIADSDIYGSGSALLLLRPRGAFVARNKFFNGRDGWYSITGADGVIFENNEIIGADLQSSGGGINTLGQHSTASRNVLLLHNKFESLNGDDREALTSDGPGGYYFGRVVAGEGRTIRLADPVPANYLQGIAGAGIFIVSGKGSGQYARILNVDASDVLLDKPLAVGTTEASIATIVPLQENYLVIQNRFSDTGIAAQFYGTSVNHIVAGNISIRTGGFLNRGAYYHHFQPSWYVQFLNNRIEEGNVYRGGSNNAVFSGEAVIGSYGVADLPDTRPPFSIGTVIRGNVLQNNSHIEVKGMSFKAPGIRDAVIEHNSVSKSDVGIFVDRGAENILIRENSFTDVVNNIRDNSQIKN